MDKDKIERRQKFSQNIKNKIRKLLLYFYSFIGYKIKYPIFLKFLKKGNKFIGCLPKLNKSKIIIKGSNNILYCEKNVEIIDSTLSFNANNSLIYLASGKHRYNVSIHNNSILYVGKNNYFNPYGNMIQIIISEERNVIIGNNNLFSFDIILRTADPHLIYDAITHNRINMSQSIYIGDHVWIGQDTIILKGSQIYSGSIVGAKSLVSNKTISSNEVWGGSPARMIRKNIFWKGDCVHRYVKNDSQKSMQYLSDEYIYNTDENTISYEEIENNLRILSSPNDKLLYLRQINQNKNRFTKNS